MPPPPLIRAEQWRRVDRAADTLRVMITWWSDLQGPYFPFPHQKVRAALCGKEERLRVHERVSVTVVTRGRHT